MQVPSERAGGLSLIVLQACPTTMGFSLRAIRTSCWRAASSLAIRSQFALSSAIRPSNGQQAGGEIGRIQAGGEMGRIQASSVSSDLCADPPSAPGVFPYRVKINARLLT